MKIISKRGITPPLTPLNFRHYNAISYVRRQRMRQGRLML
jgi:hypothetical protein